MKFIKKYRLIVLVCIACNFSVLAQFPNPLNFNTATNSTNTGTLAMLSNDLHWTAALTNSLGPYVPAVVCGNQAVGNWVNSPFPNANWITYPHTCSASPAEHSCLGNVDEFYKTTLNLPATSCNQSVATPSAYCLSLDFYADNWVSEIYVNNILSFTNPNANPYSSGMGFSAGFVYTASLCNNWQVGTNTIIVHVKSGAPSFPGWTGFLAQANQTVNTTVGVPLNATVSHTNVSCFGNNNGSALVSATGGSSFTYTWLPSGGNGSVANNLSAGNYSVIVNSASGCSTTQTVSITQPVSTTLSISNNTSVCLGNTVNISASGANSYVWSNGATGSVATVSLAGSYTVTGTNTLTGCSQTNSVNVTLAPSPTIAVAGNNIICPGGIATFSASGANSYTWSTGTIGSIVNVSPSSNTIYTVIANTNGSNCISSQTYSVNVLNPPNLSITGNTSLCVGSTGVITVNGADTYTWSTGLISNSLSVNTNTVIYSVIGTNTTTGCNNNASVSITVGNYPIISISSNSICQGQVSTITANGAVSYTWSEGTIGNVLNIVPLTAQIYTVNGSGTLPFCISSQTVLTSLLASPSLTLAADRTDVCRGQMITLSASGADNFIWSTGSTDNTINLIPTSTSIYSVTATNNNLQCTATRTIQINVNALPNISIIADSSACYGDQITLKGMGASDYLWSTGLNSQAITVVLEEGELYSVVGVNFATGCYSTCSISPQASDLCCEVYIPNTFTPNEDYKNDSFSPVSLCKFKDYKFTIYNRWGERIFTTDFITDKWDGFYKGVLCQEDVYVYTLDYTIIKNSGSGSKHFYKTGHINLIGGSFK